LCCFCFCFCIGPKTSGPTAILQFFWCRTHRPIASASLTCHPEDAVSWLVLKWKQTWDHSICYW
jgi:hypothetical protein